jgi:RHS repeat-associated protein
VYDGLGRREAKTINGSLTEFLFDGRNPVQESSGATILANILPGLRIDEFLARTDVVAGVTSNFLTDVLGSPVAVTDNAGAVQTEYTYEPFGKTTFNGAPNTSSYQFTGRENDGAGLYYYRARYYHPALQRFISEDPLGFDGGDFILYGYVKNNPTNGIDPYGLSWVEKVFMGGYYIWKLIGPVPVIIDGLGKVNPLPFCDILCFPEELNDPYNRDDDGNGNPNFSDPNSPYCKINCNPPEPPPSPPKSPPKKSKSES